MNQRELQRLETRRTLADHALRLFSTNGYEATTVEDIAGAAGVSPRTFFLHFSTKAAAAFPDHEERVRDFTMRLGDGRRPGNPLLHLCGVLAHGLDVSSPTRRTRYQLLAEVAALRDEDARTDRDYEEVVAIYLIQSWGESTEATIRAHAVANAALGVCRASLIGWGQAGIDPREVCFEILHRMIGSPFDAPLGSVQSLQSLE